MTTDDMNMWLAENMKLIHKFCHKYYKGKITSYIEYEDFFQVGSYGAWKGLKTFDEERGIKLSTYVGTCIENELRMEIRKFSSQSRQAETSNISLDEIIHYDGNGEDLTLESILGDYDNRIVNKVDTLLVQKALNEIISKDANPDKLATIMSMHFSGYNQREISDKLQVSQSWVSKKIRRTKRKLRAIGGYVNGNRM